MSKNIKEEAGQPDTQRADAGDRAGGETGGIWPLGLGARRGLWKGMMQYVQWATFGHEKPWEDELRGLSSQAGPWSKLQRNLVQRAQIWPNLWEAAFHLQLFIPQPWPWAFSQSTPSIHWINMFWEPPPSKHCTKPGAKWRIPTSLGRVNGTAREAPPPPWGPICQCPEAVLAGCPNHWR